MDIVNIVNIVFVLLLFTLFVWFLNKLNQEWRQFLREERIETREMLLENSGMIDRIVDALDSMKKQIVRNTVSLVIHDATMRGVDTDALGTPDEMVRKYMEQT